MKIILGDNPINNVIKLYAMIQVKTHAKSFDGLPELYHQFNCQQAICSAKGIDGFIFSLNNETFAITTGKKRAIVKKKSWPLVSETEEVIDLT